MAASKTHLRHATIADIPALADIGYKAFFNEPIDGHWFPFKEEYPHDYHRSFVDELSLRLVSPGNVVMVVELEFEDQARDKTKEAAAFSGDTFERKGDPIGMRKEIVAYLVAIRHGISAPSPEKLKEKWNPDTPLKKLTRNFLTIQNNSLPNRAMSAETIASYYSQASKIYSQHMERDSSETGKKKGWIDCRFLVVPPEHQGRGYTDLLVEWVANAAAREDIPVFLDTTEVALPLYVRYGARVIGSIQLPWGTFGAVENGNVKKVEALDVKVLKWKEEWATKELFARARL